MSQKRIKILYIDDEVNNLSAFKANFRKDYEIYAVVSVEEGKKILAEQEIEIIITDQKMPQITGLEFLSSIADTYVDPLKIILSGFSEMDMVTDAINKGNVHYYINKPWGLEELKSCIEEAHEVYLSRKKSN